jgi:putative endonuclease
LGREKRLIGQLGERIALEFLKDNGYEILETNLRTPLGEIDAVAKKKGSIVFIEVKTRTTSSLGPPYLAVTRTKQTHIINNALCYLKKKCLVYSDWRIDIVSVKLDLEYRVESIELIENAVEDHNY